MFICVKEPEGQRVATLAVPLAFLPAFFKLDGQPIRARGFPKDGRIIGIRYEPEPTDCLVFYVESDEFEPVEQLGAAPPFEVAYKVLGEAPDEEATDGET